MVCSNGLSCIDCLGKFCNWGYFFNKTLVCWSLDNPISGDLEKAVFWPLESRCPEVPSTTTSTTTRTTSITTSTISTTTPSPTPYPVQDNSLSVGIISSISVLIFMFLCLCFVREYRSEIRALFDRIWTRILARSPSQHQLIPRIDSSTTIEMQSPVRNQSTFWNPLYSNNSFSTEVSDLETPGMTGALIPTNTHPLQDEEPTLSDPESPEIIPALLRTSFSFDPSSEEDSSNPFIPSPVTGLPNPPDSLELRRARSYREIRSRYEEIQIGEEQTTSSGRISYPPRRLDL